MNVFCCLGPQMEQLEVKLASELPSTAKVVACRFPFPSWVPEHTHGEGIDTVWLYDAKTFKSRGHTVTTRTLELTDTPTTQGSEWWTVSCRGLVSSCRFGSFSCESEWQEKIVDVESSCITAEHCDYQWSIKIQFKSLFDFCKCFHQFLVKVSQPR